MHCFFIYSLHLYICSPIACRLLPQIIWVCFLCRKCDHKLHLANAVRWTASFLYTVFFVFSLTISHQFWYSSSKCCLIVIIKAVFLFHCSLWGLLTLKKILHPITGVMISLYPNSLLCVTVIIMNLNFETKLGLQASKVYRLAICVFHVSV